MRLQRHPDDNEDPKWNQLFPGNIGICDQVAHVVPCGTAFQAVIKTIYLDPSLGLAIASRMVVSACTFFIL